MYELHTMLKDRRVELGVSMEVAAVQIGTTRLTYSKWEKARTMPAATWVEPLAEWLDVPRWQVLVALGLLGHDAGEVLSEHLGGYLICA